MQNPFSSPAPATVVRASFVLPLSDANPDERIEDGYVLTVGSVIKEVGPYTAAVGERLLKEYGQNLKVINDGTPVNTAQGIPKLKAVILPGFVKAHGHDHEATIIGLYKNSPLTEWLDGVVNPFTRFLNTRREELMAKYKQSPNLIAYMKARVDDLTYGITSSMVHHCNYNKHHVAELVEANTRAGTKMIVAVGGQDRNYDPNCLDTPQQAVDRMDRYFAQFSKTSRIQVIPGPDQLFSNGPEMLRGLKAWSRAHGSLIHTHSCEEFNTSSKWFPQKYGMTEIQYAESIGFLDKDTILAHQVQNTDEDLLILQRTGTQIVHNPLANTVLGSGMPPIIRMLELGIPVAISTDGSGSADNQNILAAARLAAQYQRALLRDARLLPAVQVLRMITAVPAKMLRMNCGQLVPGRDADLSIVDLTRPNLVPTHRENVAENLIWASDGSEVRWVVAGGHLLKDNYRILPLDIAQILDNVEELLRDYAAYQRTAAKIMGTGAHN